MVRNVKLDDLEGYQRRRLWAWPAALVLIVLAFVLFVVGIWVDGRFAVTGVMPTILAIILFLCGVDFSDW